LTVAGFSIGGIVKDYYEPVILGGALASRSAGTTQSKDPSELHNCAAENPQRGRSQRFVNKASSDKLLGSFDPVTHSRRECTASTQDDR